MEAMALTESTYYILLALYHPQHGYGSFPAGGYTLPPGRCMER